MTEDRHSLFDLGGRVAMVTGGGSGLGREYCDILAEFGADIVCPDTYMDRAKETCEILKKYGHRTLPIEVDVSQYDQVQAMFKKVEDSWGRLDVLITNAGITTPATVLDQLEVADWHRVLNVNLHGVFYCMKEGIKIMMKQKKGSIINISSVAGANAMPPDITTIAYIASKAGVIGLTKQGAVEYGPLGIRVNCIALGFHYPTNLGADAGIERTEEERKAHRQRLYLRTPMRRVADVKEANGVVLYLASDASSFVTGATIAHDGGWTCV